MLRIFLTYYSSITYGCWVLWIGNSETWGTCTGCRGWMCMWHSKETGVSAGNGDIDWEHLFQTANQCLRNESLKGSDEKIWKNKSWIIVFRAFCPLQMQWSGKKMIIFSPIKILKGFYMAEFWLAIITSQEKWERRSLNRTWKNDRLHAWPVLVWLLIFHRCCQKTVQLYGFVPARYF